MAVGVNRTDLTCSHAEARLSGLGSPLGNKHQQKLALGPAPTVGEDGNGQDSWAAGLHFGAGLHPWSTHTY